ncbi:MAG: DUF1573 domain-containing protein [Prevotellaceae bacterium]|jgi:hypothetical protein|nr:DUF1573 domain-containing protein [Prevotellaceae bacterium]
MKKIGFIVLTLVLSTGFVIAQDGDKIPKAVFPKDVHDFGKVEETEGSVTCKFVFKNEGTAPLLVQRVQTTCGCTTPGYTKEPVLPGKKGTIKVTYSTTGRPGIFMKDIAIFTNDPNTGYYKVRIKGEVIRQKH